MDQMGKLPLGDARVMDLYLQAVRIWADEEPDIRFFYPVVTRRPVIERELETSFQHSKSREGRASQFSGALEWPITPWWQVEVEMPFLYRNPNDAASTAGPGDLELQNKFLLWKSVQHLVLVSGGFELRLPSGSERRGLGGEIAVEPFVTGGIGLGPFDVIAAIAYEWNLNNVRGPREQELTADLAVGWPVSRWFTPFLELNTVSKIQGQEGEDDGAGEAVSGQLQPALGDLSDVSEPAGVENRAGQMSVCARNQVD